MGVIAFVRTHADAVLAVGLTCAYGVEIGLRGGPAATDPPIAPLDVDEQMAILAGAALTLSLAVRRRLPLVPLLLSFLALALAGRAPLDASVTLVLALLLMSWSVGAWTQGRSALIGALGTGALVGLLALREPGSVHQVREVTLAALLLAGPWLVGVMVQGIRRGRGDTAASEAFESLVAASGEGGDARPGDEGGGPVSHELYEVGAHALGQIAAQARGAKGAPFHDPELADHVLAGIEATSSHALGELRRLAALMTAAGDGAALTARPGLLDLEYLVEQVSDAGLPVDLRVEGTPSPLPPGLDLVAYQVVQDALANALEHAGPARASVVVRWSFDELELEIVDDGPGIDADRDDPDEQLALGAIGDRVALHGGVLEAGPDGRSGYRVSARLPLG